MDAQGLQDAFAVDGALARSLPSFRARPAQQQMARLVGEVIEDAGVLVSEAGTGTGKTFAYLVPALLSGRKVIISTGTKNLQDQLFHRDLPRVLDALGLPVRVALLKGRANYLCRQRLQDTFSGLLKMPKDGWPLLQRVRTWSAQTRSGDLAEANLPDDALVWPWISSTTENCLGQNCDHWQDCHLTEARRRAQEADLVVVNHHLVGADLTIKDEGFGELLPDADCLIVDEAHQFPEVIGQFFGVSLSGRQLSELLRDSEAAYLKDAGDLPQWLDQLADVRQQLQEFRLSLGPGSGRGPWSELATDDQVCAALGALRLAMEGLLAGFEKLQGRGKALDHCAERACLLAQRLAAFDGSTRQSQDQGVDHQVYWYEIQGRGFRLHCTPLDVGEVFSRHMAGSRCAWVFTSATLAIGDSFEHFAARLGLEQYRSACWPSPFDYRNQSCLYVPESMPHPAQAQFDDAVVRLARHLVQLSRGRTFLLFTSHRALQFAARQLRGRLSFPLLVQGDAPRSELLERFRSDGNAVLLGAASFWEGVDVQGAALSCVIIDRLPFAAPSDPVMQARIQDMSSRGISAFSQLQLPQAVIGLKQGAGRLIRGEQDRGLLVICDPRLYSQRYGQVFLDSLPPMPRTRDLSVAEGFLHTLD